MTFAQIFDIGTACVLALLVLRGIVRGFTGEIVSLLGLVASIICGWTFAKPLADIVLRYFNWDRMIVELVCSILIFIAVSIVFAVFAKIINVLVRAANLSLLNHALGAVTGAARAFFLILFIYGAVSIFSPVVPGQWMRESVAMQSAAAVWPSVLTFLTERGWINLDHLKNAVGISRNEISAPTSLPVSRPDDVVSEDQGH